MTTTPEPPDRDADPQPRDIALELPTPELTADLEEQSETPTGERTEGS